MLLLAVVVVALAVVVLGRVLVGRVAPGGSRNRTWIAAGSATLALLVLGFVLVGLPGAVLFELATWPVLGRDGSDDLKLDTAWPVAIMLSFLVPLLVPPATWLVVRARPGWRGGRVALAVAGLMLAGGMFLSLAFYSLYRKDAPGRPPGHAQAQGGERRGGVAVFRSLGHGEADRGGEGWRSFRVG
jgi:hypothetical protein